MVEYNFYSCQSIGNKTHESTHTRTVKLINTTTNPNQFSTTVPIIAALAKVPNIISKGSTNGNPKIVTTDAFC